MKAFLYTAVDTGGQSARLAKALRDYEGIDARSMAVRQHVNRYPEDLRFDEATARRMFAEADVVHLHNTLELPTRLGLLADKPIVLHHHGTRFRAYHGRLYGEAQARGAIQIASTIDLASLYSEIYWLPSPFKLPELMAMRLSGRIGFGTGRVRIAHAPTNRKVKSTTRIIEVVTQLHAAGMPVELDLIERVPWQTCLARKAKADILIDQLHLGYGNNAIEAWAMGIPVIAGLDDQAIAAAMDATFPTPFLIATEADLSVVLAELVASADMRHHWGERGLEYVRRFHDERYVANRLAGIYRKAIQRQEAA